MANLIITVIAIALVAVASLMGAYYGGSAFLTGQSAANASTVLNQGLQVKGAWQDYQAEHSSLSPTAYADLTTNNYLSQTPYVPASGGVSSAIMGLAKIGTQYFAYADMGNPTKDATGPACLRIIKAATGNTGPALGSALAYGSIYASTANGNQTFGCAVSKGAAPGPLGGSVATGGSIPPTGHYVMEYLLQ